MITIKASQEIFTCHEVTNLTDLRRASTEFAKRRRLGFISGTHDEQCLFKLRDLMVLTILFQPCEH
jgi:hypothetical protein